MPPDQDSAREPRFRRASPGACVTSGYRCPRHSVAVREELKQEATLDTAAKKGWLRCPLLPSHRTEGRDGPFLRIQTRSIPAP
jgi:hypothetical protein